MNLETVDDIAERIERTADRYRNARDFQRENEGRIVAEAVRAASDIDQAREIARAFDASQARNANPGNSTQELAGRSPRLPWWKWRRWGQNDDS